MAPIQYNESRNQGQTTTESPSRKSSMKKPVVAAAVVVAILAAGLRAGCSSEPSKPATAEKPQPKAPEEITGSSAFYKCYISARLWAPDAQPYRVESGGTKSRDGKS